MVVERWVNRWFLWLSTAVLLLAALFRLLFLQDIPPGLSQDEVFNLGMPAFILQGNHAFFFAQAYGHEPLYHYLTIPFYWLLGENFLTARLPSVFAGMLLVALTMRWGKRDFSPFTAVAAGALMAVSWWAIIFSRLGIRPILLPLFLVAMAWFWPHRDVRRGRPFLAGLFLGLSLYTYTGARVVFAIPVLFGVGQLLFAGDGEHRKTAVRGAFIVLATTLLLYIPLFLTLRADPSQQERVAQLAGPLKALQQGDWRPILQTMLLTLGAFSFTGDPRWTYMLPKRPLFDLFTSLFFYAGIILAIWRIRQPQYSLLLILLLVGILPSAMTPQAPSTIRMIGAMPAVFLLLGIGVQRLGIGDWRLGSGGLTLLLLLVGGRTVQDGFLTWSQAQETRVGNYQTVLLDMATYWRENPTERLVIADSFFEQIDAESFSRNLGVDNGARWVQTGDALGGGMVLPAGEGNGRLYVPEFAPINPFLLSLTTTGEPIYRSSSSPSFAVYDLLDEVDLPQLDEAILFDDKISLKGYEIIPTGDGDKIQLMTVWQVQRPLPWNLKSFVHLVDGAGTVVAQYDGFDAAPLRLYAGDTVIQLHTIMLPPDFSGPYELQFGLYTAENGRLTHAGEPSDRIIIVP